MTYLSAEKPPAVHEQQLTLTLEARERLFADIRAEWQQTCRDVAEGKRDDYEMTVRR